MGTSAQRETRSCPVPMLAGTQSGKPLDAGAKIIGGVLRHLARASRVHAPVA